MSKAPFIGSDGTIVREGDVFIVRRRGDAELLKHGATCENPDDPAHQRIYRKVFERKRIFMPDERDRARDMVRGYPGRIVLGMTGYSVITPQQCLDWGIEPDAYEYSCMDLLGAVITAIRAKFPGVQICLVHGASDMGVDRAVIAVANQCGLYQLGHSCPGYMFYVNDDDSDVYVAENKAAYADAFIDHLDILLSVGGRMQALEHDISASIRKNKHLIMLNVLSSISRNGGPPARDANGTILDATAAFEESVATLARGMGMRMPYEDLRQFAVETSTAIARRALPSAMAFGTWRREFR